MQSILSELSGGLKKVRWKEKSTKFHSTWAEVSLWKMTLLHLLIILCLKWIIRIRIALTSVLLWSVTPAASRFVKFGCTVCFHSNQSVWKIFATYRLDIPLIGFHSIVSSMSSTESARQWTWIILNLLLNSLSLMVMELFFYAWVPVCLPCAHEWLDTHSSRLCHTIPLIDRWRKTAS